MVEFSLLYVLLFMLGLSSGTFLGMWLAWKFFPERLAESSHRLAQEKSTLWTEQQQSQLKLMLEPFRDRLKDFERKVEEVQNADRAERGTLKGELNRLMDLNLKMSQDTQQLSRALKSDIKTQGAWGELLLENILEKSGLRRNEEFLVQSSSTNQAGQVIRPDIIVKLPEGKHLIVDSKVSLTAFEEHLSATKEEDQLLWARKHVESLKSHIDLLSEKNYASAPDLGSPDFVILFMPLEPAFALAFKTKPDLLQYAWDRNIALVSPTTLLTTLRTVAALWKQERQQTNALEIARRGGALYDKFAGFVKDLESVGEKLDGAHKAYSAAFGKLSQGQGNLLSQAEKLKELGAKAEKKLNQNLVN